MKTAEVSASTAHLGSLRARISATRRKRLFVRVTTGAALALNVLIGVFAVEALLDELVELPWLARACVFLGCFSVALYFLWRESIHPLRKRLDEDGVALLIEYALPQFKTRFIASLQLGRDAGAKTSSLVRALLAQTASMAASLDFRNVVKTAKLKRALGAWMRIVFAVSLLVWIGGGDASVLLLKRAMLFNIPLPRKTHFLSITGDKKLGVGEDFKINVTAGGVIPATGRVLTTTASGQKREFSLSPDGKHRGEFSSIIRSPEESFTYVVKLNDATSPSYQVQTFKRPTVTEVGCEQVYPAYVALPPVHRNVNNLSLLAGSRLKVVLKTNMPIDKGALVLAGIDREIPLQIDSQDKSTLRREFEIPPKDLTGFSVRLVSTDGVSSSESAVYRIDLLPDHEPTVKITVPSRREELATPQATIQIAFEAQDDFGIGKATLHFTVDQGEEKTIDFDLGGRVEKTMIRRFEWKLSSLQPKPELGSIIEFWITATDCNNVTGPGIGTTEHYQTKLVTGDEKRLDLTNRLRETMGALNEITGSQQELNKNLGEPLFEKPKQNQ